MGTFQRNAIISGFINSYCLVCEQFFETEDQTFSHINGQDHENTLLGYPHLEKYGNNGIRKVKAGYFCEYCSQLMATGAKVNLHIAGKLHFENKGNMLLKQSGSALTAFDDVLITDNAWHSFYEDECILCNTEFDDQVEHKVERSHVLKLLQNQVQFRKDNSVYRKIDKNDFQCLTCNVKLPLNELDDHFISEKHKQRHIECQEEKKKHDLVNPTTKVKPEEMTQISEDVKEIVDHDNVVNNKETIAGITIIEANKKAPNTNEEKPSKATKVKEKKAKIKTGSAKSKFIIKEDSSDPVIYAKDNQLLYDAKYRNAYCKTCQNKFPPTLHSLKEHVKGKQHVNKMAKVLSKSRLEPPKYIKLFRTPIEDFIKQVSLFDNTVDKDTVINEVFCIQQRSCHLFMKIPGKFREYKCGICMMNLFEEDMENHCKTLKHEKGMREISIITNPIVIDEFIREVRPETFHCGFCNLIIPGWDATEAHLKTTAHKNCVATCNRRLQLHLPAIRAQKNDAKIKAALFDMFVNHMRI